MNHDQVPERIFVHTHNEGESWHTESHPCIYGDERQYVRADLFDAAAEREAQDRETIRGLGQQIDMIKRQRDQWAQYHAAFKASAERRISELEKALVTIGNWYGVLKSPLDQFDDLAHEFYKETGYMRPGKDDARNMHTDAERQIKWDAWAYQRKGAMYRMVHDAVTKPTTDAATEETM